ncbi:MAG: glycosyltransferase family 4 protein [Chromatiales bacterium]
MKILFFSFYYPPDLSAGSFRAEALVKQLSPLLEKTGEIHVITSMPNRYASHRVNAENISVHGNVYIHRITIPIHSGGMLSQARSFSVYAWRAYQLAKQIRPDFLLGTTSRLMTAVLTSVTAARLRKNYYLDVRDIFSETISELLQRKNRWLGGLARIFFLRLEKPIFRHAAAVNVVSQGFPDYYTKQGIDTVEWRFYPNGVDQQFIGLHQGVPDRQDVANKPVKVLYAGNIGSGQGLETILPEVAQNFSGIAEFQVIGDGGTRKLLQQSIRNGDTDNLSWFPPVDRDELLEYYRKADVLFLHLNDMQAFKRVLPSKIFEYAALGKPILAGLSGYAAEFVRQNIPYACVFNPKNAIACGKCLETLITRKVNEQDVERFTSRFRRTTIMQAMAEDIIQMAESRGAKT